MQLALYNLCHYKTVPSNGSEFVKAQSRNKIIGSARFCENITT